MRACIARRHRNGIPRGERHEGEGVLLVAGSSLAVMSGYQFVRRAAKMGVPVVIVNRGSTRGDEAAAYKLEVGTSEFLTALAQSRFSGSGRA